MASNYADVCTLQNSNVDGPVCTFKGHNLPDVLARVRAVLPSSYTGAFTEARKGNVIKLNGAQAS